MSDETVLVPGICADVWQDADSTFVPALKKDMSPEERKVNVREILVTSRRMDDKLNLVGGELLYEVNTNNYWKEWQFTDPDSKETRKFASFDEYVENELGMKRRKALYLEAIYKKLVVDLELPIDTLRSLEWSKVKEVLSIITKDNESEILKRLPDMSVKRTKEYVKEQKSGGGSLSSSSTSGTGTRADTEPDEMTKIGFNLAPAQYENVMGALKVAEQLSGSDKPGNNLDLICTDFQAGSLGTDLDSALGKIDMVIASVERAYGVKLEIKELDKERYASLEGASKETPETETPLIEEEKEDIPF